VTSTLFKIIIQKTGTYTGYYHFSKSIQKIKILGYSSHKFFDINDVDITQPILRKSIYLNMENTEETSANDQEEMELAEEIIGGRKCENTKNQYRRKFEHFRKWIVAKYPECSQNGNTVNLASLSKKHLQDFFGHICKKKKNGDYMVPVVYQTFQHVSGYKSAIKDHFSTNECEIKPDVDKMLKNFFGGYQRKIANLKQNGVMSVVEGKQPLSFKGYKFLATKALAQQRDYNLSILCHFFLLLCWNLIARCVSVGSLMYNHISWVDDAMVIVFPLHKGDQEGTRSLPKHVYANTAEPSICPILSFAIYVFTRGYDREGSKTNIFHNESESRFSKWLAKICADNETLLRNQGVDISMIGTHSFRKGIATFLSGTPGGPTAINIYLRAGWSLGPVQSRYILEGEGGDQVCGRAATGLPLTDVSFANLPAHFLTEEDGITSEEWEQILPGYSSFYPQSFREVIPYLLASLVHHRQYLRDLQLVHPRHPLFLQYVWTSGILDKVKDKVGAGCNRNPTSKMFATGVPPHLVLANRIAEMQTGIDIMREDIISRIEKLPEELKVSLLENFRLEGVIPIAAVGRSVGSLQ
jgi:hypothetical protein